MAQRVKNPPAVLETWVPSLGWEDPLENRMATHSSILAWRIPWTEEPGGSCPWGVRVRAHMRVSLSESKPGMGHLSGHKSQNLAKA